MRPFLHGGLQDRQDLRWSIASMLVLGKLPTTQVHSLLIDAASKVMHQISRQLGYRKWRQASMASLASSTSSAALEHAVHHSAEANE